MKDKLYQIAEALTNEEAGKLRTLLKRNGIESISKEQGYSGYQRVRNGHVSSTAQHFLLVQEKDLKLATDITEQFKRNQKDKINAEQNVCMQCKSSKHVVHKKKRFFQKILYMGVDLKYCVRCTVAWFV